MAPTGLNCCMLLGRYWCDWIGLLSSFYFLFLLLMEKDHCWIFFTFYLFYHLGISFWKLILNVCNMKLFIVSYQALLVPYSGCMGPYEKVSCYIWWTIFFLINITTSHSALSKFENFACLREPGRCWWRVVG